MHHVPPPILLFFLKILFFYKPIFGARIEEGEIRGGLWNPSTYRALIEGSSLGLGRRRRRGLFFECTALEEGRRIKASKKWPCLKGRRNMSECGRCWSIAALKSRDAGQMIRARPIRLCAVEKTFVVSQTSLFFFPWAETAQIQLLLLLLLFLFCGALVTTTTTTATTQVLCKGRI